MENAVKMENRIGKQITFNGVSTSLCDPATDWPSDKPDLTATALRRSVRLSVLRSLGRFFAAKDAVEHSAWYDGLEDRAVILHVQIQQFHPLVRLSQVE